MDSSVDDLIKRLTQISQQYAFILAEYCKLASQSDLADEEADCLAAIYAQAEQEPLLNFFINEFDYLLGQDLGLLSLNAVENYKNQQAWLREHLEEMPLDQEYRIEIQRFLQERGFYDGPIDGVLGDRSSEAIKRFLMEVQRLLQEQQFYDGPIDGVLGKRSVAAVKQFQQSQQLKDDGVPGKKTFSALQSG